MAENKKRAKTAIVSFVQGLEKMQQAGGEQPAILKEKAPLAKPMQNESGAAKSLPRRNTLQVPNQAEQFTLPSGKICQFLPKTVDSSKCRVWVGNARDQERIDLEDLSELKASIQAQGQLVPALARPSHPSLGSKTTHEIIYGSRRLKACQELGIKLKILEANISDQDAVFFMDAENASREDLSLYEKARIYSKWLEEGVFATRTELAKSLGISDRWVRQLLGFLKVPMCIIESLPSLKDLTSPRADKILFLLTKYNDAEERIKKSISRFRDEKAAYTADELFERLFKDLIEPKRKKNELQALETKQIVADDGEKLLTIKTSKSGRITLELNRTLSPQRLSRFLDGLEKVAKKI